MTYEPPDRDESFDRRIDEEEREQAALDAYLDSLDADPMTAYKQKVEEPEL